MKHFFTLYFIATLLTVNTITAQTEEILRKELVNMHAISKIEMPAHTSGIYLYPEKEEPIDIKDYSKKAKKYGFSIYTGDTLIIKNIKVKKKHIEIAVENLDPTRQSSRKLKYEKRLVRTGVVSKSEYERLVRKQQMDTAANRIKKDLTYFNGSRLNIKLERKIKSDDLTVDMIKEYLVDYIDFTN